MTLLGQKIPHSGRKSWIWGCLGQKSGEKNIFQSDNVPQSMGYSTQEYIEKFSTFMDIFLVCDNLFEYFWSIFGQVWGWGNRLYTIYVCISCHRKTCIDFWKFFVDEFWCKIHHSRSKIGDLAGAYFFLRYQKPKLWNFLELRIFENRFFSNKVKVIQNGRMVLQIVRRLVLM